MNKAIDYFIPQPSYWPIIGSLGLFTLAMGFILRLSQSSLSSWVLIAGALILCYMLFGWFSTVIKESLAGYYSGKVDGSFRGSMLWFIFSEVMFFAAFFGALYYTRSIGLNEMAQTPLLWPDFTGGWPSAGPEGARLLPPDTPVQDEQSFSTISPWGIPFLNTLLLLTSSVTITFSHWALLKSKRWSHIVWLALTVALGAIFLYFQAVEYIHAYSDLGLTLGTGIYGATFFMLTGFHGLHVTLGAIILFVVLLRSIANHFSAEKHFAFEAGAWYWHFVDTVWVGLFIFVYIV